MKPHCQRETVALVARACLADPRGEGNVTLETLTSLTEKAVAKAARAAKASTDSLTKRSAGPLPLWVN